MKKIVLIEGMSCSHCSNRVEKALNKIEGVEAKVDLKSKSATLIINGEVADQTIRTAVDDAGYNVTEISEA